MGFLTWANMTDEQKATQFPSPPEVNGVSYITQNAYYTSDSIVSVPSRGDWGVLLLQSNQYNEKY